MMSNAEIGNELVKLTKEQFRGVVGGYMNASGNMTFEVKSLRTAKAVANSMVMAGAFTKLVASSAPNDYCKNYLITMAR